MTRGKRVLNSSVLATMAAAGFLAAASVTGALPVEGAAKKGDRFEIVGEAVCGEQAWPNITAECVAWMSGKPGAKDGVRFITVERTDAENRVTELERVEVPETD